MQKNEMNLLRRRFVACVYCSSKLTNVQKGEHIVPKAIGGAHSIRAVCQKCNNEVLSEIDKELCSRSPLALIGLAQSTKHLGHTWDIDQTSDGLLLETQADFTAGSQMLWPQVVFDRDGIRFYADHEEAKQYGFAEFKRVIAEQLYWAKRQWQIDHKRLHFERLTTKFLDNSEHRFPPRAFVAKRLIDFAPGLNFRIGYCQAWERMKVLSQIDKILNDKRTDRWQSHPGAELGTVNASWEQSRALRALAKIAVNLLVATHDEGMVTHRTFPEVFEFILGKSQNILYGSEPFGFISPGNSSLRREVNGGHSFRLVFSRQRWHAQYSFYSGQVCAVFHFPGKQLADTVTLEVQAELRRRDGRQSAWRVSRLPFLLPVRGIPVFDASCICPSIGLSPLYSRIEVKAVAATASNEESAIASDGDNPIHFAVDAKGKDSA